MPRHYDGPTPDGADPAPLRTLAAALQRGELTSTGLANRFLAAAEERAELNCLIHLDPESVLEQAADADRSLRDGTHPPGALHGIPYVVKDVLDSRGKFTSGGTEALREHPPKDDAPVITSTRRSGAVLAAKANLHELSFGITSNNACFGPVRNPCDRIMIPGGSSGGSAVAVAAGLVPFALGADTGGSARIPAALCGITGFRPSLGRYSQRGVVPISFTRDAVGTFGRTVDDIRLVDSVLHPTRASTPGTADAPREIRLGRPAGIDADLDPAVAETYARGLAVLADAGVRIVDVDLSAEFDLANEIGPTIALYELPFALTRYLARFRPEVTFRAVRDGLASQDVIAIWDAAVSGSVTRDDYLDALRRRVEGVHHYTTELDRADIDGIIFPTTPLVARPIGQDDTVTLRRRQVPTFATYTRFGNLAGVLGLPGISLPGGRDAANLPIGIELDARPGADELLLTVASAVEHHLRVADAGTAAI